jgi:hypothetical protein
VGSAAPLAVAFAFAFAFLSVIPEGDLLFASAVRLCCSPLLLPLPLPLLLLLLLPLLLPSPLLLR